MTTKSTVPAATKLHTQIATAQKQTDAAKRTAKLAKLVLRQAKQKFKDAKRAAKKLRKTVKALKDELAALKVKKPARKPVARKTVVKRDHPVPAPLSVMTAEVAPVLPDRAALVSPVQ